MIRMDHLLVWTGLAALVYLLWKLLAVMWKKTETNGIFTLPSDVRLEPQPLLTDQELLLYNLVRMAVQDRYLVFARVPLRCVLRVEAQGPSRLQVLRRLALKHLDFVLVHPGSRVVEQVVQLDEGQTAEATERAMQREIQAIVQAAGIRVTTVPANFSYNVQQLEAMLDVGEPE